MTMLALELPSGGVTADEALAQLRELTLQPADWLRLLTFTRVTAVTARLEYDAPAGSEDAPYVSLDSGHFDDLYSHTVSDDGKLLGADGALPRLREVSLTPGGWLRVLLVARVMAVIGPQQEVPL